MRRAEAIFLCVSTPMAPDGGADLAQLESAVREVRDHLPADSLLVTKSTVPVGTATRFSGCWTAQMVGLAEKPVIIDTRNLVDPRVLERAGAVFRGTGRAPSRDSGAD